MALEHVKADGLTMEEDGAQLPAEDTCRIKEAPSLERCAACAWDLCLLDACLQLLASCAPDDCLRSCLMSSQPVRCMSGGMCRCGRLTHARACTLSAWSSLLNAAAGSWQPGAQMAQAVRH